MRDLFEVIPDVATVLELQPQELGATLLFLFRKRGGNIHLGNLVNEFDQHRTDIPFYPQNRIHDLKLAFYEATAWLVAQGLLITSPTGNVGGNDWKF